jgi:hypothetical protein
MTVRTAVLSSSAPTRVEKDALKSLLRLAYATTHERGDIHVGRSTHAGDRIRLEAWAREVEPEWADARVPARVRAEAETAAYELGSRLEVLPDRAGRKIIFRIDARLRRG